MFGARTAAAILFAAAAAAIPLITAASASASPVPQQVRAGTFITDRPDGGNGNPDPYWADDTFARTLTITRTGGHAGDWTFTASLTDAGAFTTIKGAQVPNQAAPWTGDTIRSAVTGLMTGYDNFSFTASALPSSSLVPSHENDHGQVPADDTSTWYELAFPHGTVFSTPEEGPWSWSYLAFTRTGLQVWTDALNNGYGDLAGDGQITG